MPYKSFRTEGQYEKLGDFFHIYTNTTLAIDLWRPSQPNDKTPNGEKCIRSYFGNKFNKTFNNIIVIY